MPKYDYHCDECEQTFELKLPFGSPIDQTCPQCDSTARRLLTPPALVFKGSGFYKTADRSENNSKQSSTTKETKSATTTSSDTNAKEPTSSKSSESTAEG